MQVESVSVRSDHKSIKPPSTAKFTVPIIHLDAEHAPRATSLVAALDIGCDAPIEEQAHFGTER